MGSKKEITIDKWFLSLKSQRKVETTSTIDRRKIGLFEANISNRV